jgi:hypothetical protein
MNEYKVSDYGIFTNAINTSNALNTKFDEGQTKVSEVANVIGSGSIFMGPAADSAKEGLTQSQSKLTTQISNFTSIINYLTQTSSSYQAGDQTASQVVTDVGSNGTSENSTNALNSGTMKNYQFKGRNFNVVNTKTDIGTYEQYIQKYKLCQNGGILGGDCMLLSQYYATDLLRGSFTNKSTMVNTQGSPATRINERMASKDPNQVLQYTYQELTEGHPVVLQVSQVNSNQGLRHLVTAVGYDSSVSSAADLNPNNILVLDCVDGKIQTLGQSRSEGGHERYLFAQGGNYQALGPTEVFLSKEVNNQNNKS